MDRPSAYHRIIFGDPRAGCAEIVGTKDGLQVILQPPSAVKAVATMQSHHSHSGGSAYKTPFKLIIAEFCLHAVNTLEEVILEAIRQKFTSFALTEHMPRDSLEDFYPEEVNSLLSNTYRVETSYSRRSACHV
jgi:hypothetical protein